MDPITKEDVYFDYQIGRIVEQQKKTNVLLKEILDALKPPKEEVEKVDIKPNDSDVKRKRR